METTIFRIPKDRFYVIVLVLFIMWLGIMVLFYLKADEVTKHPCQICADKMGDNFNCITNNGLFVESINWNENGSKYTEGISWD